MWNLNLAGAHSWTDCTDDAERVFLAFLGFSVAGGFFSWASASWRWRSRISAMR
jgi:hypothetical protein